MESKLSDIVRTFLPPRELEIDLHGNRERREVHRYILCMKIKLQAETHQDVFYHGELSI